MTREYDRLDRTFKRRIERIPGVAKVEIQGAPQNEVEVAVLPDRLSASGIGPIPLRLENSRFVSGVNCDMEVFAATPGQTVAFLYSVRGLGSTYIPQLDVTIDLAAPALAGSRTADANGYALLRRRVPPNTQGRRVWTQAAEFQRKSNVVEQVIE